MNPSLIPLDPIRQVITERFAYCVEKTPDQANTLNSLRDFSLSLLAGSEITLEDLEVKMGKILKKASAGRGPAYGYSAVQHVWKKVTAKAKDLLSSGVPIYPTFFVSLRTPTPASGAKESEKVGLGDRTRLGGKPQWIQGDDTPECPDCKKLMTFVAQIDSVACSKTKAGRLAAKKGAFKFGDAGMIYVFWCPECLETRSLLQSG